MIDKVYHINNIVTRNKFSFNDSVEEILKGRESKKRKSSVISQVIAIDVRLCRKNRNMVKSF